MLLQTLTVALLSLSTLGSPFRAPVPDSRGLEKRAIQHSFVGCVSNPLSGDTLVTPQSPDGCAYGCANRGGGYSYSFSYYQVANNTCICSQSAPQAQDYITPCPSNKWSTYSLTTEFRHLGCRASISGTPSTSVTIPYLPWCFNYCASSTYMYFTPKTDGGFDCYCDNTDFGVGTATCPAAGSGSYGSGAGYYYSK